MDIEITVRETISVAGRELAFENVRVNVILGKGTTGVVFGGVDEYLERPVAVKIWIPTNLDGAVYAECQRQRGALETLKLANALSSHVVQVYDAGQKEGYFYCIMERFPTQYTLQDWLDRINPSLYHRWVLATYLFSVITKTTSLAGTMAIFTDKMFSCVSMC